MFASLLQEVGSAAHCLKAVRVSSALLGEVGLSGILLKGRKSSSPTMVGEAGLWKAQFPVCPAYSGCCARAGSRAEQVSSPRGHSPGTESGCDDRQPGRQACLLLTSLVRPSLADEETKAPRA